MDWMPFWLIRIFSEFGLGIALGLLGALFGALWWFIQQYLTDDLNKWRKWMFIPLACFAFACISFEGFYFYVNSQDGFRIDEELFGEYYYVGRVKDGIVIGKGRLFDITDLQLVYSGDFQNNWPEGKGTLYCKNGDRYEGDFVNGEMQGQGTYYFASNDEYHRKVYKGDFVNGKANGQGTFYYTNGDRYEGDVVDDKFQGYGTAYFANGNRYDGNFLDDQLNGQGTFYFADGGYWTGQFVDNKAQGWGVYYYVDGTSKEVEAIDGMIYN